MKKIMFNDKYGLTEAVLNGIKTQTRRIAPDGTPIGNWSDTEAHAHYKVGEVVAVAQSYKSLKLNDPCFDWMKTGPGWTNKMFVSARLMPHHIRITNIRLERLQDISDADCLKEGIRTDGYKQRYYCASGFKSNYPTPRDAYAFLIDKVSGKGTWDSNTWVFVYDFELSNMLYDRDDFASNIVIPNR